MKVVSFSLYGDNPKYILGAIMNARLIKQLLPEWEMIIFHDNTVPSELIGYGGPMLWRVPEDCLAEIPNGLFWRFTVSDLTPGTRFIVRDTDSRISEREVAAIDEWEQSGMPFHSMRDHPVHHHPLQGGMWGGIAGFLPPMATAIINWDRHRPMKTGRADLDQVFLNEVIWPQIKEDCLQHDSFFRHVYPESFPFPTPRVGQRFVGESFNENDQPREGDYQQLPIPPVFKCDTCQEAATVHVDAIGCHFCESCVAKIDARIKQILP